MILDQFAVNKMDQVGKEYLAETLKLVGNEDVVDPKTAKQTKEILLKGISELKKVPKTAATHLYKRRLQEVLELLVYVLELFERGLSELALKREADLLRKVEKLQEARRPK